MAAAGSQTYGWIEEEKEPAKENREYGTVIPLDRPEA